MFDKLFCTFSTDILSIITYKIKNLSNFMIKFIHEDIQKFYNKIPTARLINRFSKDFSDIEIDFYI